MGSPVGIASGSLISTTTQSRLYLQTNSKPNSVYI
ncbi:hypothetical protein MANES_14G159466v8 [Manihot esculenta]|uniref:Uncharacterized protein n=1 Tax=Manihot esculenta TaxID=3983 RepID=A0ACB7GIY1_MANES|nr:hypothetical protein MANES_14G159466v8 [Manihot esculenta]